MIFFSLFTFCFSPNIGNQLVRYEETFSVKSQSKLDPYLCITPPALREAEYLQSEFGALGCKRE